jgi:cell wall-associated NlpC family hydrolase
VLAVASVEGGFNGAVGDNGTSFGPFQLHWGGAMPGKYRGNSKASHAWANSRAGIIYALNQMAGHARGLKGRDAVSAIVTKFERPAAPGAEIEKAFGRYGKVVTPNGQFPVTGNKPVSGNNPAAPLAAESMQSMLASQMLSQASATAQGEGLGDASGVAAMALARRQAEQMAQPAPQRPNVKYKIDGKVDGTAVGAVKLAEEYLGTPYSWGGGGKGGPSKGIGRGANTVGFDCSGLLQYVWAKQGVNIPRVTYDQWRSGKVVGRGQLRPGDAVFFHPGKNGPEHVGMYVGNGKFIEAPRTGLNVRISNLAGRKDFMGARRFK